MNTFHDNMDEDQEVPGSILSKFGAVVGGSSHQNGEFS